MKFRFECAPLIILIISLSMASCNTTEVGQSRQGQIFHMVALDIKEGIEPSRKEELILSLMSLKGINSALEMEVSGRYASKDPRLDEGYDLILSMYFATKEDMKYYETHPLHVQVRSDIKDFLAGPPVVFDSKVKK